MGGRCSCNTVDDEAEAAAYLSKNNLKRELRRKIEENESCYQRRNTRTRSLSAVNEIEQAIETHRAHQETYDMCIEVLHQLDPAIFTEIRVMHKPPQSVVHIIAVGAMILGETEVEWKSLQKFLLKSKDPFLQYDFDTASREDIDRAMAYADSIGDLFDASRSQFASDACYYIFIWCRDIFQLHRHRTFLESREISYAPQKLFSTRSFEAGQISQSLANGDAIFVKQESFPMGEIGESTLPPILNAFSSSFAEMDHNWMDFPSTPIDSNKVEDDVGSPITPSKQSLRSLNSIRTDECVE